MSTAAMRKTLPVLTLAGAALGAGPAFAASASLTIEVPRLKVAEYHRPYMAAWIERPDQSAVTTVAVWYEINNAKREGETWLKDLRQWWRRTGRELKMPMDGVSGATRAPGPQTVTLTSAKGPLAGLPAGQYALVVEAAREVGGREVVKIPFQWPPKGAQTGKAQGSSELGAVTLSLKP